jgi:pilus assembly protein CpaC
MPLSPCPSPSRSRSGLLRSLICSAALALGVAAARPAQATDQFDPGAEWIDVEVGQSFIFRQPRPIARVLISDDQVAELKLLEEGQFQVRGRAVGTTDLWIWYRDTPSDPVKYELTIHRDLSDLIRRVDQLVDGTPPRIYPLESRLVAEGPVNSVQTLEQIANMASVYDEDFVNLMSVTGDHQIQLRVVFAEVNRTALREMGLNSMYGGSNALGIGLDGPTSTGAGLVNRPGLSDINRGQVVAPAAEAFNVLGIFGNPVNLSAILSVLETNSVSKVLAQPTLVALSGQQAEFLAGGEIPIPVAQFGNRISIEFKEYGVKLVFVPTVLGENVVDVRVYVEVSDVDSATAIRVTGIEIPGFLSRKTQSHLRMESGTTFAMAGMLHDSVRATYAKVPLLGDIPIVGSLFRYVQHRHNETELMIFVTPELVRPMASGEVPPPPGTTMDFNPNDFEFFLLGLDHRVGSRTAEPTGPIGLVR